MRIKLTLYSPEKGQLIPINYQYALSSFIYRTIERSDNGYSRWLHEHGFASGNKKFKFFTFSLLNIPQREIIGDRIKILCDRIELTISMLSEKSIEHFIIGMFENQEANIRDSRFKVKFIEQVPQPKFSERMRFKTLSPIVLSRKNEQGEEYLGPDDPEYFEYLKRNLEEKYIAHCLATNTPVGQTFLSVGDEPQVSGFKLLNGRRSKLITIKEGRPDQTRVRGFDFSFELEADPEFMRLGYECGFGKLNSLGFGCVGVLR